MTTQDKALEFAHGFHAGNYAAAYESTDWEQWSQAALEDKTREYRAGAMLGFFSSCEDHECGDLADELQDLDAEFAELAALAGIGRTRDQRSIAP